MFRGFCCALCALLCSAASADTVVQDGDYYERLWVTEGSFQMTGGRVDELILYGSGPYDVSGGSTGSVQFVSGDRLTISGGDSGVVVRDESIAGSPPLSPVIYEGRYFRVYDRGRSESNSYKIEGWLADGSWIQTSLVNEGEFRTSLMPVHFRIVPGAQPAGDTDGDWDADLSDLNNVRNNFGGAGLGDLNADNLVDLSDLNEIRNAFGIHTFTLDRDNPGSFPYYEVTSDLTLPLPPTAVPEPATAVLLLPLAFAWIARRGWPSH